MKKFFAQYISMTSEQQEAFDFFLSLGTLSMSILAALFSLIGLFV